MKLFLLLGIASLPLLLCAQTETAAPTTNTPPAIDTSAATNAPAKTNLVMRAATEIFSDHGDFDLKQHVAIYTGHVRVIDPKMKLTCEILTATLPEGGSRVDRIVAERNVVIDGVDSRGEPVHAVGEKAVYTYNVTDGVTNELIELTGDPRLYTTFRSVTGDSITWNRGNNTFHGTNLHMIFQQPVKENSTNNATPGLNQTHIP